MEKNNKSTLNEKKEEGDTSYHSLKLEVARSNTKIESSALQGKVQASNKIGNFPSTRKLKKAKIHVKKMKKDKSKGNGIVPDPGNRLPGNETNRTDNN